MLSRELTIVYYYRFTVRATLLPLGIGVEYHQSISKSYKVDKVK